jgi:SpoVK/Ycf46/Vps4 family AAA+-type ATPase
MNPARFARRSLVACVKSSRLLPAIDVLNASHESSIAPGALDRALFRRFDDIVMYGVPGPDLVERAIRNRLGVFDTASLEWERAVRAAEGLSYAELTRACEDAAKEAILEGTSSVSTDRLVGALEDRKNAVPK